MHIVLELPESRVLQLVEENHLYDDVGDLIQVLKSTLTQESRLVAAAVLMSGAKGRAIGVALVTKESQVQVFIDPSHRRMGLGSTLVRKLIEHTQNKATIPHWGGLNEDASAGGQRQFWNSLHIPSSSISGLWSMSNSEYVEHKRGNLTTQQIKARRIAELTTPSQNQERQA